MESCARLSVSLEGPGLFALTSSPLPEHKRQIHADDDDDDLDEDDYNNDEDEDDNEGDEDEEDNDNNHFNDHLQPQLYYSQQAANVDEEFANEIDIANGGGSENAENQSYKANFRTCQMPSLSRTNPCKSKTRSYPSDNGQMSGTVADSENTFTDSQDDLDDEMANVVKRRFKQNKKKSTSNSTAQLKVQQQQRKFKTSATASSSASNCSKTKNFDTKKCDLLTNDYEYIANTKLPATTSAIITTTTATTANASSTTLTALGVETFSVQQKSRVCSRCKRGIRHSSSCSSSTGSGGGGGANGTNSNGMTMEELRAVNRYAESTKSLSYLPQVRDEYLLASRISV